VALGKNGVVGKFITAINFSIVSLLAAGVVIAAVLPFLSLMYKNNIGSFENKLIVIR
jgi:ABC-type molybdate transport system permease subunit